MIVHEHTLTARVDPSVVWDRWTQVEHWPILLGLAISGVLGQYAITEAFKRSDASVVAPFDYTALIWGITFDAMIWHTLPDRMMLMGAAIIIARVAIKGGVLKCVTTRPLKRLQAIPITIPATMAIRSEPVAL